MQELRNQLVDQLRQSEHQFLLVDASALPNLLKQVESARLDWHPLREGANRTAAAALPLLVVWPPASTTYQDRFLAKLCDDAGHLNALSVLSSPLSPQELTARLIRRTCVRSSDGIALFLRFADTRVFQAMCSVLTAQQMSLFTSVAAKWSWVDRQGVMQAFIAPYKDVDAWPDPFDLEDHQLAALMQASMIDQVMHLLNLHAYDLLMQVAPVQRVATVQRLLLRAERWKLESAYDLTVYCQLALSLGADFDETPSWVLPLQRVAEREITMDQALEHADASH